MKVAITGGGTGGHTTPLIAVGEYLRDHVPEVQHVFAITEKGADQTILEGFETYRVRAGKYRRYHGESLLERLRDFESFRLNVRDAFRFIAGLGNSLRVLHAQKPDVVFIKGGYVSLPVGIAAWMLSIPYVTHDSDSIPSLTNRLLARGATSRLSGFPQSDDHVKHVGIPVRSEFSLVSYKASRESLQLDQKPYVVVVGGSQGAQKMNEALVNIAPDLAKVARVCHVAGHRAFQTTKRATQDIKGYDVYNFIALEHHFAAADVVVTRAGATTLAELAALSKAVIAIPNPLLTDGHQLKNGQVISEFDAGIIIDETSLEQQPAHILEAIQTLINDDKQRQWLGDNLHQLFPPDASKKISDEIISVGRHETTGDS